jgi:hypothetical protein
MAKGSEIGGRVTRIYQSAMGWLGLDRRMRIGTRGVDPKLHGCVRKVMYLPGWEVGTSGEGLTRCRDCLTEKPPSKGRFPPIDSSGWIDAMQALRPGTRGWQTWATARRRVGGEGGEGSAHQRLSWAAR